MTMETSDPPSERPVSDASLEYQSTPLLEQLRREGFPGLRKLDLTTYFGRHLNEVDAEDILRHSRDIDVLIGEFVGTNPRMRSLIRDALAGKILPETVPRFKDDQCFKTLSNGLRNTPTRIAFADVPAESDEGKEFIRTHMRLESFTKDAVKFKYTRAAAREELKKRTVDFARTIPARERYIVAHIGPAIIEAYPNPAQRENISHLKVLMQLGKHHAHLFEAVQRLHPPATKQEQEYRTSAMPYATLIFKTIDNELIPESLSDDTLIEVLVGSLISGGLSRTYKKPSEHDTYMLKVINEMNDEERQAFCTAYTRRGTVQTKQYLENYLREKGLMR